MMKIQRNTTSKKNINYDVDLLKKKINVLARHVFLMDEQLNRLQDDFNELHKKVVEFGSDKKD